MEKEGEDGQFWQAVSMSHQEGSTGHQLHGGLYSSDSGLEMFFCFFFFWRGKEGGGGHINIFLMH